MESGSSSGHVGYRQQFGKFDVAMLDAESRLELAKSTPSHDVSRESPSNLLQMLYKNEEIQEKLDEAFFETFGEHIAFDFTALKNLYLRVGPNFRELPDRPEDASRILIEAPTLDSQGDGMRSFVAVILSLLLTTDRMILLDEPDAFLHPEQARRLGRWLAEHSKSSSQQIVIATHNSHFLQGLISTSAGAQIYRLNRQNGDSEHYRRMPNDVVSKFGTDPLLSSQRVIEAIFHTLAVVCESDSDRVIYQAVAAQELNNTNVLFVNAQNKQTCAKVIAALNRAGIAARSVVDIDMLRDGNDLQKLMGAHNVPSNVQEALLVQRKLLADAVEDVEDSDSIAGVPEKLRRLAADIEAPAESPISKNHLRSRVEDILRIGKWDPLKRDGIGALGEDIKVRARLLLDRLKEFGIVIVPAGELESWIDLGVRKNKWVEPALTQIYGKQTPQPLKDFVQELCEPIGVA